MILFGNKRSLYVKIMAWLIIAVSCIGVNAWSKFPLGNATTTYIIDYTCLIIAIRYVIKNKYSSKNYLACSLFLIWAILNSIRGFFVAENYWEYKQLASGILMCSFPIFAYAFRDPNVDAFILRKWNIYMSIFFFLLFVWACGPSCYFFLLPFVLLYGSFFRLLSLKWKIIVIVMLVAFCLDYTARSNIIKVLFTVMVAIGGYLRSYLSDIMIRFLHWLIYGMTIFFLCLGIGGKFNILENFSSSNEEKYVTTNNSGEIEDLSVDTRTFIYNEVIASSLKNGYIIWGCTPSRGNESYFVLRNMASTKGLHSKNERHANELVHLNIFTWLGLIGVVLYSWIYAQASYMAVYHSKNFYVKMIGLTIAFHWAYGWIEDVNTFTIQNMWLWMMIAMGLSSRFREMTDRKFSVWLKSLLY